MSTDLAFIYQRVWGFTAPERDYLRKELFGITEANGTQMALVNGELFHGEFSYFIYNNPFKISDVKSQAIKPELIERFINWKEKRDRWATDVDIIAQSLHSIVTSVGDVEEPLRAVPCYISSLPPPDRSVDLPDRDEAVALWGETAVRHWDRIRQRVAFYRSQELL